MLVKIIYLELLWMISYIIELTLVVAFREPLKTIQQIKEMNKNIDLSKDYVEADCERSRNNCV